MDIFQESSLKYRSKGMIFYSQTANLLWVKTNPDSFRNWWAWLNIFFSHDRVGDRQWDFRLICWFFQYWWFIILWTCATVWNAFISWFWFTTGFPESFLFQISNQNAVIKLSRTIQKKQDWFIHYFLSKLFCVFSVVIGIVIGIL